MGVWHRNITGLTLVLALAGFAGQAGADCNIGQPAKKLFTVQSCRLVNPQRERRLVEFVERYPAGFVNSAQEEMRQHAKEIMDSYRGAVLEVEVDGAGLGRYFYPSREMDSCKELESGVRVEAMVGSACCDGDPNPPCFLGFAAFVVEGSEKIQEP